MRLILILIASFLVTGLLTALVSLTTSPAQALDLNLKDLKAKFKVYTVTVSDPVYKTEKTYDAFLLKDVLLKDMPTTKSSSGALGDEIVFEARDGYAPSISKSKLESHTAYLAFQEHGSQPGKPWHTFMQGKEKMTPAPFYLVWPNLKDVSPSDETYPWPYQLVKIQSVVFKEKYAKIYPENAAPDSAEMQGFLTFKNDCIRCHSVNLVGGGIGPELNTPKNVLEYWNEATLRQFIKNPGSFRAKDKMPPFPNLTDSDIDHIFAYFRYLEKHREL
jgi:mono/diheme cytochrome c family protein